MYAQCLGIEHLTIKQQYGTIGLILTAYRLKHKHKWFDGFVSIDHRIWRKAIGESAKNKDLIKQIKAEYFMQPDRHDYPEYSHRDGIAKAYALNPQTEAIIEAMDKKASKSINENIVSQITDGYGQPVRKDIAVMDRRTSQGTTLHGIPAWCPVNITALTETLRILNKHLEDAQGRRAKPPIELSKELKAVKQKIFNTGESCVKSNARRYEQYLRRSINEILDIINDASGRHKGLLPQRYMPSKAGRFYAVGLNLQNCSRLTRNAALHGCYSYDIESCHHAIVLHFADLYKIPCKQLRHYVEHKKEFRLELANALGGKKWLPMVKTVLISIIYGARKNEHYGVIRETLGAKGYSTMFDNDRFAGLFKELQAVFAAMIDNAEREPKTNHIINALSKIDIEAITDEKRAAHILQGIESQALQAALSVHKSAIVPLHDGWACSAIESIAVAENAILKATGIPLKLGKPEHLKLSGIEG